ncbi:hypothetical protein FRC07_009437 [Ceratobasidium sp. 392]|nr:hypothetical protein FRC07_009437 [Ceratobasidium sp. 392]
MASFGSNEDGINPTVLPPSDVRRVMTSFEGRNRIHVLSFSAKEKIIASTALQVKQKVTEFSFRSNDAHASKAVVETTINCLLDCHMEVWTRFPVAPAVRRSTLLQHGRELQRLIFASPNRLDELDAYFARMITKFEQTTRKPMDGSLSAISVIASSESPQALVQKFACSMYPLGGFVVELLCLIPLHLAITRDNRFIPLKDGVWDPVHESSLLGADVPTVIEKLSLGWYESLFQSYMATKPVRVVSSMGEQSVELPIIRNGFGPPGQPRALQCKSRDTKLLTPYSNAPRNQSTLAIIIKDVTDSDSKDIVKEFQLKFQCIVQREQQQNFISRLHRGRIQIIPWPVINSPSFYTLFQHVRRFLDKQPVTHSGGGVFLHNLKTLMAKIKVSDWGSLDQNLATHRALQLTERLQVALSRGRVEQGIDSWGPLKRLFQDLDQRLEHVQYWIEKNVERFPAANQDIRNIHVLVMAPDIST